jgi:hypothetical protein
VINVKIRTKTIIGRTILLVSLFVNLILAVVFVKKDRTYVQLPQNETFNLEENNPIDEYFQDKLKEKDAMSYAEIRNLQRLYGKLWKREYENVIFWLKERCKYSEDQNTIEKYESEVKKYIETSYPTFQISYDESDILDLPPDKRMQGVGESALKKYYEGEMYKNICLQLIKKSSEKYTFLENDYDEVVIE